MRKIHTTGLALLGLALAVASFGLATAADPPQPELTQRAFMPAVAGDDSSFKQQAATSTPIPTSGCAGLRTPVKTLSDALAGFDRTPQDTTVSILLAQARPADIADATARLIPFEGRVVEVEASVVGFRRTANGGIDLAIAPVGSSEPIVASMPGAGCLNASGTSLDDRAAINKARTDLQLACGNPPDSGIFKALGGTATVRGVPFWGTRHSDMQGAGSGIELGPVLFFEFNPATSCDANASKTPYPTATPTPVIQEIRINLLPQVAQLGQTIVITIDTIPDILGLQCTYELWQGFNMLSNPPSKPTNAAGEVSWEYTIPVTMPLGQASVTPKCLGANTDGSARLTIIP